MKFDDYFQIQKLITRYAQCADRAEFDEIAELYRHCVLYMPGDLVIDVPREGIGRYLEWYKRIIRVYPDSGTTKTRRLVGTIIIDDDGVDCAKGEWNVVCFQAIKDFPLQAIAAATLYDKYQKVGEQWRLIERREDLELVGDLSRHIRFDEVNR
jgi:3-phenylpropionate/cinnamic acid dioxygenase small subunit